MTVVLSSFADFKPNPDWAKLPLFDRKEWKRMPFGAFVDSINERVEPGDAAEEIYVGLEHLDSQNLHIRRWGKGSDVIGTKLRFRKGDIIFGRRRAYQRKLAVAEFDGICSAHAMVVRAKPGIVLPEFLPFLMMSDKFMNRAVEISVGSLSPTINWKTLKLEEFDFPPLDQQRRIEEILWAVDEANYQATDMTSAIDKVEITVLKDIFSTMRNDSRWKPCLLEELGSLKIGQQKSPRFTKGICLHPYLKVGNVSDGRLKFNSVEEMDFDEAALAKYRLEDGDILLTEGDLVSAANVGRSAMFRGELHDCGYQNHLIRLRCRENVLPDFALQLLRYLFHVGVFARAAKCTTVISLGIGRVAKISVAVPPLNFQKSIAERMRGFDEMRMNVASRVKSGQAFAISLANSLS